MAQSGRDLRQFAAAPAGRRSERMFPAAAAAGADIRSQPVADRRRGNIPLSLSPPPAVSCRNACPHRRPCVLSGTFTIPDIEPQPLPPPPGATLARRVRIQPGDGPAWRRRPIRRLCNRRTLHRRPTMRWITEMPTQKIENSRAVFSGLDKITGRIICFDAAVGETVQFGALQVTARVCYTRPPTEATNTDAFVQVDEVTLQGEVKRIFSRLDVRRGSRPARGRASNLRCLADRLRVAGRGRRASRSSRPLQPARPAHAFTAHAPGRAASAAAQPTVEVQPRLTPRFTFAARRAECHTAGNRTVEPERAKIPSRRPARHRAACGKPAAKPRPRRMSADAR